MYKHKKFEDLDDSDKIQLQYYGEGLQEAIGNLFCDDFDESDFIFMCNRIRHILEILDYEYS